MSEQEVKIERGNRIYRVKITEAGVEAAMTVFPIKYAGNYVRYEYSIERNGDVTFVIRHDGWSCGCGALTASHASRSFVSPSEAEEIFSKVKEALGKEDKTAVIEAYKAVAAVVEKSMREDD